MTLIRVALAGFALTAAGLLLTGCGNKPAATPTDPWSTATATQRAAPVGTRTPEQIGTDQSYRDAVERVYPATMRTYQATNPYANQLLTSMTDDQLIDLAKGICAQMDAGANFPAVMQVFTTAGVRSEEAFPYIDSATKTFCYQHAVS